MSVTEATPGVSAALRSRVHGDVEVVVLAALRGRLDTLTAAWSSPLHPRGKDGRFIEVGGLIELFGKSFDNTDVDGRKGFVERIDADPKHPDRPNIVVRLMDPQTGRPEGRLHGVHPDQVIQSGQKARLAPPSGAPTSLPPPPPTSSPVDEDRPSGLGLNPGAEQAVVDFGKDLGQNVGKFLRGARDKHKERKQADAENEAAQAAQEAAQQAADAQAAAQAAETFTDRPEWHRPQPLPPLSAPQMPDIPGKIAVKRAGFFETVDSLTDWGREQRGRDYASDKMRQSNANTANTEALMRYQAEMTRFQYNQAMWDRIRSGDQNALYAVVEQAAAAEADRLNKLYWSDKKTRKKGNFAPPTVEQILSYWGYPATAPPTMIGGRPVAVASLVSAMRVRVHSEPIILASLRARLDALPDSQTPRPQEPLRELQQ